MSTAKEKMAARVARAANKVSRATIEIRPGELPLARTLLAQAIRDNCETADVYVNGSRLTRPHTVMREGYANSEGVRESVESLEMVEITPATLRDAADRVCAFTVTRKGRDGKFFTASVDCPSELATRFYEAPDAWVGLPRIERLSETPIFDGKRLRSGPGLVGSTWVRAPLDVESPERLTRKAAEQALDRLRILLSEFPFAGDADEAAGLALIMTSAMRTSLGAAPGFIIDKNDYGAGASTLGRIAGVIATGRAPPVLNVGKSEEETTKLITAALIQGRAVLALDNLREGEPLASTLLAQVLSEPQVEVRVLGESRTVICDSQKLVIANGVNVSVVDDLVRRFMRMRIEARDDRPAERTFNRPSIIEDVRAERSRILSDCFTITAAYLASGDKVKSTAMAGFDQFTNWTVKPLIWLGLPDIVKNARAAAADDPNNALLLKILPLWRKLQNLNGSSIKDMLRVPAGLTFSKMREQQKTPAEMQAMKDRSELRALFAEATNVKSVLQECETLDGGLEIAPRLVGKWLSKMKGRQRAGLRFVNCGETSQGGLWKVEMADTGKGR